MEEEENPNLANINIDEITASLQDTKSNDNIIDINGEINGSRVYQAKNNNNEDIDMNIEVDQEIDPFLSQIVERELEVLEQHEQRDPIIKKAFDDLNETISKISMPNHIKQKKLPGNHTKKKKA